MCVSFAFAPPPPHFNKNTNIDLIFHKLYSTVIFRLDAQSPTYGSRDIIEIDIIIYATKF